MSCYRRSVFALCAAASLAILINSAAAAGYPDRPITMIVPWGTGGSTDATARIIATLLEKELDTPVNVQNRTGGNGVVGHTAISSASPDGYTIGIITAEIAMMHHQGLTRLDYSGFTPLSLVSRNPAGVLINANSQYTDMKSLAEALKNQPKGTFKASGTAQGGIWHVALGGLLHQLDLPPDQVTWVPSTGGAAALQDMVAKGVDFVTNPVPEGQSLIEAKRVKGLAVFADSRNPAFPDVPTLQEAVGKSLSLGTWAGIVGPKGLDPQVAERLNAALQQVIKGEDYLKFMAQRGFYPEAIAGSDFGKFLSDEDAAFGKILSDLGMKSN